MLELNLVRLFNKLGVKYHYAINDEHYDAMLASPLDPKEFGEWEYLGTVYIEEDILNECGYYFNEH